MHHGPNPLREKLGATGNFPEGKLNDDDDGELSFGISADNENRKVIFHFGKPVSWIGFNRKQALEIANLLILKANKIKIKG